MSTLLKAFVLIWPFLRSVIFKDRTVLEVVVANRQVTYMFAALVFVAATLYVTTEELAATNAELYRVRVELSSYNLECDCAAPIDTVALTGLDVCQTPTVYDKTNLMDRLLN